MRPGRIFALAGLLLASVLAAAPAGAGGISAEPKLRAAAAIEATLAEDGAARVIVVFEEPEPLAEADAVATLRRRAAMRRSQDALVAVARGAAGGDDGVTRLEIEPMLALEVDAPGLTRLLADPRVREIHPDAVDRPLVQPSLELIGMPPVWRLGGRGQGQIVAVIDSGVDASHPYLYPRVVGEACFTSKFKAGRGVHFRPTCPGGGTEAKGPRAAVPCGPPACAHGTHVAGIAAGSNPDAGEPRSGVAPEAEIVAVNVFSQWKSEIGALNSDVLRALEWVYARRKDYPGRAIAAVNLSLGGYPYSAERCDGDVRAPIIERLRKAGIATVIASGNDGLRYEVSAPSCISSAVTVGATNGQGKIAKFSNMSAYVDLMAPGVGVLSSVPGGYGVSSGTSMAAPHVAGAFAALRSLDPKAGLKALADRLEKEGTPVPDLRKEGYYEQPLLRVDRAAGHFARDAAAARESGVPSVLSIRVVPDAEVAPAD